MILGFLSGPSRVPRVQAALEFPDLGGGRLEVSFVVDTGAANVVLGPFDARRLESQLRVSVRTLAPLPQGVSGVGGSSLAWTIPARVWLQHRSLEVAVQVMEPLGPATPPVPSLLGRAVLSAFTILVDTRNDLVVLYE